MNRDDFVSGKIDAARLDASLDRIVKQGLLTDSFRNSIECRWVWCDDGDLAYVKTDCEYRIFFTQLAFNLSDYALDTLMWHELSHIISGFSDHGEERFEKVLRRKRWHIFNEWVVFTIGIRAKGYNE